MRLYVESHMQRALEQEEFRMYLQPKMDLHTGLLIGAEALVRWQSKDKGLIFPNQFIPLFEENGFCVKLDLYMVEQVCKQLRQWIDEGITPINISVNQTRLLFASEGYVENLLAITEKYNISPQYITLEILESLALEHMDQVNACIDRLRAAGFRISMDDFGSGYSSLNTLGRLKIDELKRPPVLDGSGQGYRGHTAQDHELYPGAGQTAEYHHRGRRSGNAGKRADDGPAFLQLRARVLLQPSFDHSGL